MLAPPVVGFFEFSMMRLADHLPKAKLAKAFDAYWRDPSFLEEVSHGDTVIGRALVHESALFDDLLSEVLDWERAGALVEGAGRVSVTNCYCRHKAHHLGQGCENPLEMCMSLGAARTTWCVTASPGRSAGRRAWRSWRRAAKRGWSTSPTTCGTTSRTYVAAVPAAARSSTRCAGICRWSCPAAFSPRWTLQSLQRLRSLPARLSGRRHLARLPAERLRRPGGPGRPAGGGRRPRSLHRMRGVRRFCRHARAAARAPARAAVRSRELGRVRGPEHDGAGQGGGSAYRRHRRARTGLRQRGGPDHPLLASGGSPDSERAGPLAIRAVRAVEGRASALGACRKARPRPPEAPGITADLLRRRRRRSSTHPGVGSP